MPAFLTNIGPTEIIIVLAIIFFLFGRKVLMSLGKTSGETVKEFKKIKKSLTEATDEIKSVKSGE